MMTPFVGLNSSYQLHLGFGSGVANIIGDFSTTNFIGIRYGGNWTTNAFSYTQVAPAPLTRVGTTVALGASFVPSGNAVVPAAGFTPYRAMLFVDITKGSPNFTAEVFTPNSSNADVLDSVFFTQVALSSPAVIGYAFSESGPQTMAFSESNGVLNSVQCSWNGTASQPQIFDLAVVLLA
jgi:hypothetical protein